MDVKNNYKKQRQNICKAIVCCQYRGGGKQPYAARTSKHIMISSIIVQ